MSEQEEALRRELRATQEMLFQVLAAVGTAVVVTKESMERGIGEDKRIDVQDNVLLDAFVFSVVDK